MAGSHTHRPSARGLRGRRGAALALAGLLACVGSACGGACGGGGGGGGGGETATDDEPFTIRKMRGVVRLAAEVPLPEAGAAPITGGHCDAHDDRTPRPPRVDPATRGLAECLVWLVGVPEDAAPAPTPRPVHLDQRGCEFTPRAQVVALGSLLRVANSDSTLHNVRGRFPDGRNVFNVGMAPGTPPLSLVLHHGGSLYVGCDVHPWMGAWMLVVGHRFAAVTGDGGSFAFPAPPAGTYELRLWQPQVGRRVIEVEVAEGPQDITIDATLGGSGAASDGAPAPGAGSPSDNRVPSGGSKRAADK